MELIFKLLLTELILFGLVSIFFHKDSNAIIRWFLILRYGTKLVTKTSSWAGMILVVLIFIALLIWLWQA